MNRMLALLGKNDLELKSRPGKFPPGGLGKYLPRGL